MRFGVGECEVMHLQKTQQPEAVSSARTQGGNPGIAEGGGQCAAVAKRPATSSARHMGTQKTDLTHSHASVLITCAPQVALLKKYRCREKRIRG